jgi:acetyl esterase
MPIHPIIDKVIKRAYLRGHSELPTKPISEVRAYYDKYPGTSLKNLNYEDITTLPGVRLRIHKPRQVSRPLPTIILLRASAYIFGKIEEVDLFSQYVARKLNCNVVALEPRLSPEFKFPIPVNDCLLGIQYLTEHHQKFNIDLTKLVLWGNSSGGSFAAALSHALNEAEASFIKSQILFYPMLDFYNEYPSKTEFDSGFLLDRNIRNYLLTQYCNTPDEYQDIRVSPLLAEKVEHLPSTLVIGAQYDPLRDEGMQYIKRLAQAKVPIHGGYYPGMIHGFLMYGDKVPAAKHALNYALAYLKEQFIE